LQFRSNKCRNNSATDKPLKAEIWRWTKTGRISFAPTERLLQTHGLARLTMREIAREAKVAEGLIYHHFKDKAELILEVVEQRLHDTKNVLQTLPLRVGPVPHCRKI